MAEKPRFSPVRQKMVELLSKGTPVDRDLIQGCLYDELGDLNNIHKHLNHLRSQLKTGYEIIPQLIRYRIHYRIVKTLEGEDPFA